MIAAIERTCSPSTLEAYKYVRLLQLIATGHVGEMALHDPTKFHEVARFASAYGRRCRLDRSREEGPTVIITPLFPTREGVSYV